MAARASVSSAFASTDADSSEALASLGRGCATGARAADNILRRSLPCPASEVLNRSPATASPRRRLLVAALAMTVVAGPAVASGSSSGNPYGPSTAGQKARGYLVRNPEAYARAKAAPGPLQRVAAGPSPLFHPRVAWGGVNETDVTPPDTTGAIGTTRYIELVNLMYGIYDRNGNALSKGGLDTLTGDASGGLSDPQIIWDPDTSRFYYSVLDFNTDDMEVGFSKTDSPSSASDFCRYDVDFGYGADLPDYPKLGDTKDFLLIGANIFASGIYYDRADVMWAAKPAAGTITTCPAAGSSGWPLLSGVKQDLLNSDSSQAFTPVPANQVDSSSTGYVVSAYDSGSGTANKLEVFPVTRNLDGSANIAGTGSAITVSSFSYPPNAPESGTTSVLDTLDARLTQAVSAVDPSHGSVAVWTQHAVSGGAGSQVRWYEINPSGPSLYQSGIVSSSSLYVFNGAISPDRAVNGSSAAFGDSMALGFNTSSSSTFPAIQMVTKQGTGAQSAFTMVKQSAGKSVDFSCSAPYGPPCRWGDYSGASPDPAASPSGSAGQIWLANQYNKASSSNSDVDWLTWLWTVTPGSGGGGGGGAPTITSFSPTSGPRGSQVTVTGTNFVNVSSVQMTNGTRSVSAAYTVDSSTEITATVPSAVPIGASLKWKVTTSGGSVTSTSTFKITSGGGGGGGGGLAPTISDLTPTSGPVGTQVTITGTNFTNVTSVKVVKGTLSKSATFTVDSSTQITATVPSIPSGNTVQWKVTTAAGSVTSAGTFSVT
jgi:IPT/TIG domain